MPRSAVLQAERNFKLIGRAHEVLDAEEDVASKAGF